MPASSSFTDFLPRYGHNREAGEMSGAESKVICMVAGIAIAMFIGLFGWGADYFGWHDPTGRIQLALVTSFILGAVASYKARG
jgi:hypothetical protein